MKRILGMVVILLGIIGVISYCSSIPMNEKRIGIVVPIEHQAMKEITDGFLERIEERFGSDVVVDIQNAQGDRTIQKAIIENFKRRKYDLIVPIGTDVTLMTQHIIKVQPILGLDVTNMVLQEQPNVTGLRESPILPSYLFIKKLLPGLKKMTMVFSGSDKNHQMVQEMTRAASTDGVVVQPIMIQTLADLYVLAHTVDCDSEAIFIAKDHLVACGAPSLSQVANQLSIPLITSDIGSVLSGGAVGMGNHERDIGSAGGQLAILLLEGASANEIPILPLNSYTVFVNAETIEKQGVTLENVIEVADRLGYPVEIVNRKE